MASHTDAKMLTFHIPEAFFYLHALPVNRRSIALADLQALVTVAGEVGGGEGGDDACCQRMALERFQAFD
ncbi:hypothetical protein HK44_018890 [Pseudomonas fluorescens HK44]|uniref:Uncharacterized protein n=1 Tax=Pseudomonas fluorescens HK44 TaxID=1042209 RepID=A0A010T0X4_PSEFL|nr:hypothetical protein HK44_018890 [Pseudomonas fluorescens HK44]